MIDLSKYENVNELWTYLSNSISPTDDVTLSYQTVGWMQERWIETNEDPYIPADLFYSDTIPLPNVKVTIDNIIKEDDVSVSATFLIFEKPLDAQIIDTENIMHGNKMIGMFSFEAFEGDNSSQKTFVLLSISKDNKIVWHTDDAYRNAHKANGSEATLMTFLTKCVSAWYGIQISLLHPTLKYIFEHPKMAPVFAKRKKSNKKRRVGYIRKHKITMDDINEALFPNQDKTKGTHVITCPVWWVIGHWRVYKKKNTKIWIKGYWKGNMRDVKRNLDEGRDREIIVKEKNRQNESV